MQWIWKMSETWIEIMTAYIYFSQCEFIMEYEY